MSAVLWETHMEKVNIAEKFARISEYWKPYIAAELNGQLVKLDKLKGEFVWHHHANEDEMFLVVKGKFRIEFRDETVHLGEGEFIVVPRGVEHRPVADEEASHAAEAADLPQNWLNQLRTGRLQLLRPIYLALCRQPARRAEAARLYRQHREGYHPIARQQLERLFREQGVAIEEVKPLGLGRRPT